MISIFIDLSNKKVFNVWFLPLSALTLLVLSFLLPSSGQVSPCHTYCKEGSFTFQTRERIRCALSLDTATPGASNAPAVCIHLNFLGSKLARESEGQLTELLAGLNDEAFKAYRFEIAGQLDGLQSDSPEARLSQQRVKTVKEWLIFHGLPEERLAVMYGNKEMRTDTNARGSAKTTQGMVIRTTGLVLTDDQEPLVKRDREGGEVSMEVPRSLKYSTGLLEEGVKLYRARRYSEAISMFEKSLEDFKRQGFEEGEVAALGNLYLAYLAVGDKKKALEYLEDYRKKRRRK